MAEVVDGDTIRIGKEKIRLHGIDAPEARQLCQSVSGATWQCGLQAGFALADIVKQEVVTCTKKGTDRYGRILGICYQKDNDLNGLMVSLGQAVAYRRYSKDYINREKTASSSKLGIWSGQFVLPWLWRRGQRLSTGDAGKETANASLL